MFTKTMTAGLAGLTVLLGSAASLSQSPPTTPGLSAERFATGLEFPVIMRQNVVAGATAVGSKIEAKLAVATLVNGVVVPQGASFSGEVIESVAKTASGPSRLSIRMDSAKWKNGGAPKVLQLTKKIYLTGWYYPLASLTARDLSNESSDTAAAPGHRGGAPPYSAPNYPAPNSPASQPFPGRDSNRSDDTLSSPSASSISQHRVLMKNIESTRNDEGAVILVSKRSSIKLDRMTTYVLAAGDLKSGPG